MDKPVSHTPAKKIQNTKDRTWVFDLDNTLYHSDCNLFSKIDIRMGMYLSDFLNVPLEEARKVQKDYFRRYGTTLNGLIKIHNVDPGDFLNFVHNIDLSPLQKDDPLKARLKELKGRRFVFTNGDVPYATRVLDKVGILNEVDGIFDIARAGFIPKPQPEPYRAFVKEFDIKPETAIMFEDMARNLIPASQLGMTTVWIKNASEWGDIDYDKSHIHYEAEYITDWFSRHLEDEE